MRQRSFYQVLGIAPSASSAEVRAAYARLVKRHHPDIAGELPERLRTIQQAYRCLSDPAARAEHDRALAEEEHRHMARQFALQRRLRGYDRRHPHAPPHRDRRWGWRPALATAIGLALAVRLSIGLFGG